MKNKISYLLLLLLASACGPDPSDEEPPFVCEGELPCLETDNSAYAAAYINGEVWESGVPPFGIIDEDNSVYLQNETKLIILLRRFESSASGGDDVNQSLAFHINPEDEDYTLMNEVVFSDSYSICHNGENDSRNYILDENYSNSLYLKQYDFEQRSASGYFDLQVVNPYCNDTLLISDGRFNCFFTIQ